MNESFNELKQKLTRSVYLNLLAQVDNCFDSESPPLNMEQFNLKYRKLWVQKLKIEGQFGVLEEYEEKDSKTKVLVKEYNLQDI